MDTPFDLTDEKGDLDEEKVTMSGAAVHGAGEAGRSTGSGAAGAAIGAGLVFLVGIITGALMAWSGH